MSHPHRNTYGECYLVFRLEVWRSHQKFTIVLVEMAVVKCYTRLKPSDFLRGSKRVLYGKIEPIREKG